MDNMYDGYSDGLIDKIKKVKGIRTNEIRLLKRLLQIEEMKNKELLMQIDGLKSQNTFLEGIIRNLKKGR